MVTLSSAFMSSSCARTMRNVSLALGRPEALGRSEAFRLLETDSDERRGARAIAGVGRGSYPFRLVADAPVRTGFLNKIAISHAIFHPCGCDSCWLFCRKVPCARVWRARRSRIAAI